jgi:hypothetical protein
MSWNNWNSNWAWRDTFVDDNWVVHEKVEVDYSFNVGETIWPNYIKVGEVIEPNYIEVTTES